MKTKACKKRLKTWGIWLTDYELENTTFTNQVDFEKYKKEINANFEAFRNGILGDFEDCKVFNNSYFLNKKCIQILTDRVMPGTRTGFINNV
jgi:hypothetical protein